MSGLQWVGAALIIVSSALLVVSVREVIRGLRAGKREASND